MTNDTAGRAQAQAVKVRSAAQAAARPLRFFAAVRQNGAVRGVLYG
jgi:hypothetical protein